jgi:4-amino-4-deoxy-L-arabinose transferase-like glycosyltransferase
LIGHEWLINALFAALTVILVYRIGREVYGQDAGVVAAVLVAFSPAALLLNASLMAHSAALFFTTLFMWGFWRLEKNDSRVGWAVLAGAAIGAVFAVRPLSAIAVGLPFVVWRGVRTLVESESSPRDWNRSSLTPLSLAIAAALLVATTVPLFNLAATGDPRTNLYELVWPYDSIGFGEGHGRTGHTLEKGFRHTRFDLSLAAADLFGWQLEPITPELTQVLQSGASFWPATGLGFVMLPVGVLLGLASRRKERRDMALRSILIGIWLIGAICWLCVPWLLRRTGTPPATTHDPTFAWLWIVVAMVWLLAPLTALSRWRTVPQVPFTWLLFASTLAPVILHIAYWTGSQRYSTRYYFEALAAAALLSAIPLARVAGGRKRIVVYVALLGISILGLVRYSMPRVAALQQFNGIDRALIRDVEARKIDDRDQLVVVTCNGQARWQWYGALMAVTTPFLDGEIVAVRDLSDDSTAQISASFSERQLLVVHVDDTGWSFSPSDRMQPRAHTADDEGLPHS